jgi:hypothetical protein
LRSCTSPQFGSCLENFVIRPKVSGQTLSLLQIERVKALNEPAVDGGEKIAGLRLP